MPVEEPQVSGPFKVRVKVGESVFEGMAHTIQAARHDAAAKAIRDMEKRVLYKDNVCLNEGNNLSRKDKNLLNRTLSNALATCILGCLTSQPISENRGHFKKFIVRIILV